MNMSNIICRIARKRSIVLLLFCFIALNLQSQGLLRLNLKNATAKEFFKEINKLSNLSFIYSDNEIEQLSTKDYIGNHPIKYWLDLCLKDSKLEYEIENQTIYVRLMKKPKKQDNSQVLKGIVLNQKKEPLSFINVVIKNSNIGVLTDDKGRFTLSIPPNILNQEEIIILFTSIQVKPYRLKYLGQKDVVITMLPSEQVIEEVIVTGIYERKKESFTGSSATYSAKDLKNAGNVNVIQSLKSIDPTFNVLDNTIFGSDPNKLPDIEIRGKTSIVGIKEAFSTDPNQPLFILDGFESDLQTIMDINMDRIASITILKDAASTAIYGSKAANGVIVVETKAPISGELRLSYKGDFELNIPDLSGYNLMNSSEKLEFEHLSGRYSALDPILNIRMDSLYKDRLIDVAKGVDTYWLSEPLRIGLSNKHNLYVEGGDNTLRYGLGVNYNSISGVMKESSRDILGGNIDLMYRKGKFRFSNKLSIDYVSTSSPIVYFKEFAQTNPYYKKTNILGEVEEYLEKSVLGNLQNNDVQNPIWDSHLNNYNNGNELIFRNNFIAEWQPITEFKLRTRLGITKKGKKQEYFYDPRHSIFNNTERLRKGKYTYEGVDAFKYEGDISLNYGKLFLEKHQLNLVIGWNFSEIQQELIGFSTIGFSNGHFNRPSFSSGYQEGDKPLNFESRNRATSFFLNGGYTYDNRYLTDFNYRIDGASIFGSNKRFTTTWSLGFAWNIHNEHFLKDKELFNILKLRFSIGNPGNQNFASYLSYTTFKFNETYLNNFGNGVSLVNIGNPNLKWQKTLDKNMGLDVSLYENRLHFIFDLYHKRTSPLLAKINIPASSGLTEINTNIGSQSTKGFIGTAKYAIIFKPEERINWTLSATLRTEKDYFEGIGNSLDKVNNQNREGRSYERYYDGGSPTDIWAVRSAGIDPASGRELFITREGKTTFKYSYDDEVVVGNTRPNIEGVIGNVLYYRGFSFSFYLRYRLGGQIFNNALYRKVENISLNDLKYNQDKRALYGRWKNPGDIAEFKSIKDSETTPMSSRFVMLDNSIIGESFQMGYEFNSKYLKKLGISELRVQMYANNIFRISSVKTERGIEYPFARSLSMSINLTL